MFKTKNYSYSCECCGTAKMISPEYQGKRIYNKGRCIKCNCEYMVLEKKESIFTLSFAFIIPALWAWFSFDIYKAAGYQTFMAMCMAFIVFERLMNIVNKK